EGGVGGRAGRFPRPRRGPLGAVRKPAISSVTPVATAADQSCLDGATARGGLTLSGRHRGRHQDDEPEVGRRVGRPVGGDSRPPRSSRGLRASALSTAVCRTAAVYADWLAPSGRWHPSRLPQLPSVRPRARPAHSPTLAFALPFS